MKVAKKECKHRYVIGYSFRSPSIFFRSLPCDLCGERIKLALPWKLLSWVTYFVAFIVFIKVDDYIESMVNVDIFMSDLILELFFFVAIMWIVQIIQDVVFRYAKWLLVVNKKHK